MQFYKVKLLEGHKAKGNQIDENKYLAWEGRTMIYTLGEARIAAKTFGGVLEKYGKDYFVNEHKMLELSRNQLSKEVLNELEGRESAVDADVDCNTKIYFWDVFEKILFDVEERLIGKQPSDSVLEELNLLVNLAYKYTYILIS